MMAPLSDDRSANRLLYPMHEEPFDSAAATRSPRRGHDRRRTTPTKRRRRGRVLHRWHSVRRDGRSTSTDRQSDADPLRAVAVVLRRRRLARRAAMAWPRPLQIALDPVAIAKSLPRRLSDSHSLRAVAAALRRETKRAVVRRGASQSCMSAGWCWALRSSGVARSKRWVSDCCGWQPYASELCGSRNR